MHNGQIGGFSTFRRDVDMQISDDLYHERKGATDSEAIFLLALADGLERDPKSALERTVGRLEELARKKGRAPYMRLSICFSDGVRLYAIRYASDAMAPTLYHRWVGQGRVVVSEPIDEDSNWKLLEPDVFAVFENKNVSVETFNPMIELPDRELEMSAQSQS